MTRHDPELIAALAINVDGGDLRSQDTHVRTCHHRILTTGDVAAHAIHRNILVSEDHAGDRLLGGTGGETGSVQA